MSVFTHLRCLGLEEREPLVDGAPRGEAGEVHGAERVGGVAPRAVEKGLVAVLVLCCFVLFCVCVWMGVGVV